MILYGLGYMALRRLESMLVYELDQPQLPHLSCSVWKKMKIPVVS